MKKQHEILFTPFKIGNLEIKNRFVMTAMTGTALINKGVFNKGIRKYYIERARNGVGLIISGCSVVYDMFGRDIWVNDAKEVFKGPVKDLMEEIHKEGTKFFMQIGAGLGRVANLETGQKFEGADASKVQFASSELPNVWNNKRIHREITTEEIKKITDAIIETAYLAKNAGIDGVEIHAVHEGYLLDQFAISNMNHRTDEYGGSLENRLRFATDIVRGIKEKCGADFPVSMRFGVESKMKGFNRGALPGENYVEFGRKKEESLEIARLLIEAGVDILDCDNGTYDSWYWAHPPVYMTPGCNIPETEWLSDYVDVPLICAGRLEDPDMAAEIVSRGKIAGIGIARQFLADPAYVTKIEEDRTEDIRPCIACHNGCLGALLIGKGVTCALRPVTMHEDEYEIIPAKTSKKILIAGGGIAGMEVARLAVKRGHTVVIYEADDKLGGAFIAAAAPSFKEADKKLIAWYEREMKTDGITVVMNTKVTPEIVKTENPDVLVIACGGDPKKLPVTGSDLPVVADVKDELLKGCDESGNVVIIGGGLSGCEAAYEIAKKGVKVTVLEVQDKIIGAPGISMANSSMLKDLLKYNNVTVMTSVKVNMIKDSSVEIELNGEKKEIPAARVIIAAGYNPRNELADIKWKMETYKVGDASKVGNLMDAIKSAYEIALKI